MLKPLILSAVLVVTASVARAEVHADQIFSLVSQELPVYVKDVDPATLSRHQLLTIYSILHSGRSGGDKIAMIRSVIGGRGSLRGLLFN